MTARVTRKLYSLLMLALIIALTIPAAAADEQDREAVTAYWTIVGDPSDVSTLARAMRGEAVSMKALTAVTADELMAFAAANRLPVEMARYGWYAAMVQVLRAQPQPDEGLALFLSMPETWRDSAANADRRAIRRELTQADVERISRENGLPGGFVAWLMLEDEWHEGDWEDADEWREGRQSWIFADHAYEKELRENYGKSAVVDDDEVERVLQQNGIRYDD